MQGSADLLAFSCFFATGLRSLFGIGQLIFVYTPSSYGVLVFGGIGFLGTGHVAQQLGGVRAQLALELLQVLQGLVQGYRHLVVQFRTGETESLQVPVVPVRGLLNRLHAGAVILLKSSELGPYAVDPVDRVVGSL